MEWDWNVFLIMLPIASCVVVVLPRLVAFLRGKQAPVIKPMSGDWNLEGAGPDPT